MQEVERKITKFQLKREELKAKVVERYEKYLEAGSTPTPTYEALSEEFDLSIPTIIRYIKGDPVPRRKKRKYTLRKKDGKLNNK